VPRPCSHPSLVGHSGAQERVRIQKLLANLRDRVAGQLDELRDVRGAVRGREALEQHRRAVVSVLVDVVRNSCVYGVFTFEENTSHLLLEDQLCQEFMRAVLYRSRLASPPPAA